MTTKRLPGTLDDFKRCPCGMDHKVIGKVDRTPVIECPMLAGNSALHFVRGQAFLVIGTEARAVEVDPDEPRRSRRGRVKEDQG